MKFIENVEEQRYKDFYNNFADNNFMQSYEFGIANKIGRGQIPCYVGLEDDNGNLVAVSLLVRRDTPLNMCYFYAPRGFLIDFNNKELLAIFTSEIKAYLKRNNAIYLKIDPEIMYQENDSYANVIENGKNNFDIFNNLIELGYKHKGFNKLYDANQPRYTFRIPLDKPLKDIEANASTSFLKTIKRSYFYDLEITETDDIKTFYELIKLVAEKDGFSEYKFEYYEAIYDEFSKDNNIMIHQCTIYPDKVLENINIELEKNKDNNEKLTRLNKDLNFFKPMEGKYPDGLVIASLVTITTNNKAWTMYIGNNNIGQYTFAISRLYYEALLCIHNKKLLYLDLFGVCGDPNTNYKNLANIYEFKRKFGGELIEFIGEFDLINKPFWYKVLPVLLKIYRKLKRK